MEKRVNPKRKNIVIAVFIILVAGLTSTFIGCDIINSIKDSLSKSKDKKAAQTTPPSQPSQQTVQPTKNPPMTANTLARVGDWTITIEQFNDRLVA